MSDMDKISLHAARNNYWTHFIFPARTMVKDIAYWVTEIAAGLIFLSFITRIDLTDSNIYKANDIETAKSYTFTSDPNNKYSVTPYEFMEGPIAGIPLDFNTHLLNNEYGWICLCYAVKHFIYLIDTGMLLRRKYCMPIDLVAPILNCGLWVLWMIYGFTNAGYDVYAGVYVRYVKDSLQWSKDNNIMSQATYDQNYASASTFYESREKWIWLWVPTIIVAAINLILWVLAQYQKRSSAFTNVALSTVFIPLQLFFLHLFLKGSFISSNAAFYADIVKNGQYRNIDTSSRSDYVSFQYDVDYYETRWIFFIIYLFSYVGTVIAGGCLYQAYACLKISTMVACKYVLYALFFIAFFIWCLAIDRIIYQQYVMMKPLLLTMHIILLVLAFFIGIISVMQRHQMAETFYSHHKVYNDWKNDFTYNH